MTEDEMQRTMQFILDQQAQFATNIQRLEESHALAVERIGRLEGAVVGVVNLLDRLTQAQERTVAQVLELTGSATALAGVQTRTDEGLKALIDIIERHFSSRRDGESQGQGESASD